MKWLITGGAGFIGCNAARRLMEAGHRVVVFDNLSRRGASENLAWLREHGEFSFIKGDVRDFGQLEQVFREHQDADVVLHLAAQVAVTTSVQNPREDFDINALGTFNVCEAVRLYAPHTVLLNASTNKVYGELGQAKVEESSSRYRYVDLPHGIPETLSIDFHSPYGCSKGAGDQYVKDYGRIYGLKTVNFRQSCIYGPRQFGIEDQGWVAWFAIASVLGQPITIYGDGKQVRDVLYIDDLVDCYVKAVEHIGRAAGKSYNIGGGPANTLSLLELLGMLRELLGKKLQYTFSDWRPGDQRVFVCDIRKAREDLGWQPHVGAKEGVERLFRWVRDNRSLFIGVP
ncbi:MAG: SDR family NAD(P)-dependent oxidoreductase [Chloroflexi bacterium]|nr:SDR family NAD(P)-dependent oxidoreductase [Chloroflexota bacterium]